MRVFHFVPEPAKQFALTSRASSAVRSGRRRATASRDSSATYVCRDAVVVALDRQQRLLDTECCEESLRLGVRLDRRHGLRHPTEHERPGLVAIKLDGHDPHARLELDDPALERLRENPRRAEDRMTCHRQLVTRREDADSSPSRRPLPGNTNVVSEKPISSASALHQPSASISRASVKTASWFPASAVSVKTSTTT